MTKRFQIEEIIAQDHRGIAFRCIDSANAGTVVLRRFFPFGAGGDGFSADQAEAYRAAVERLAEIDHPCVRRVIAGGCDPVDGMPFIVTRWTEGITLEKKIAAEGALSPAATYTLLEKAIDASAALSSVLGAEALWIDSDPSTIVLASGWEETAATFWISPMKWLGGDEFAKSPAGLAALTEACMGWGSGPMPDKAGMGLGGWLRQLKKEENQLSLDQIRTSLQTARAENFASVSASHPMPTARASAAAHTAPATIPAAVGPEKKSRLPVVFLVISLLLASTGAAWYFLMGPGKARFTMGNPAQQAPVEEKSALDIVNTPTSRPALTKPPADPPKSKKRKKKKN